MSNMNYLGDGRLFCLEEGGNLTYLCTYDGTPFLSLHTDLSAKTKIQNGTLVHSADAVPHYGGKTKITDCLSDGVFVRHIETTRSLSFRFHIPPYCHLYRYPSLQMENRIFPTWLLIIPQGVPKPEGGATQSEHRLLMSAWGDCIFSKEGTTLEISAGKCTLLFALGNQADEIDTVKTHIEQLSVPTLSQSAFYQRSLTYHKIPFALTIEGMRIWHQLSSLVSTSGAVISGHGEHRCYLADQILCSRAFLHLNRYDLALKSANFLLSRFDTLGYLPLVMSAQQPTYNLEETDIEYNLYPAAANLLLDVCRICKKRDEKQKLEEGASRLMQKAHESIGMHGLHFTATEFYMRKGTLPPIRQLCGNLTAEAEYRYACAQLPAHTPKLQAELPPTGAPAEIDRPCQPKKARQRHTLHGFCATCRDDARYFGWLRKDAYGAYLCPSCYCKGKRTTSEHAPILLCGSYAASMGLLYRAGSIDRNRYIDILNQCVQDRDKIPTPVSFYESALLAASLADTGHPQRSNLLRRLDEMYTKRTFPISAAECAAYLLAQR